MPHARARSRQIRHLELYEMALRQMVNRKKLLVGEVLGTKNVAFGAASAGDGNVRAAVHC